MVESLIEHMRTDMCEKKYVQANLSSTGTQNKAAQEEIRAGKFEQHWKTKLHSTAKMNVKRRKHNYKNVTRMQIVWLAATGNTTGNT